MGPMKIRTRVHAQAEEIDKNGKCRYCGDVAIGWRQDGTQSCLCCGQVYVCPCKMSPARRSGCGAEPHPRDRHAR